MKKTQLIVALDFDNKEQALNLVDQLKENVLWYKIGKQLFTLEGKNIVRELKKRNKKVFLDLKFHDIPSTVSKAVSSALKIGADMINFHASGGSKMMKKVVRENPTTDALLMAVTILTSMDNDDLREIGYHRQHKEQVTHLAKLSQASGVNGVVCSAWEIEAIRQTCGENFKLVVPGIRPSSSSDDQVRITTPKQASVKGADYIVVGRPITQANDKVQAVKDILNEL